MDMEQKKKLISEARELGCKSVTIDGITYEIGPVKYDVETEVVAVEMPDADPMDEDEVKYWSTPYYDYLQEQKKLKEQQLKETEATHGKEAVRQTIRDA